MTGTSGSGTEPPTACFIVLEVTPGFFVDNAALAFSPDGRRFAFSAGQEAALWDVATGELTKTWKLPPGLADRLAFSDAEPSPALPRGDGDRRSRAVLRPSTPANIPGSVGSETCSAPSRSSRWLRSAIATSMSSQRSARRMENTM